MEKLTFILNDATPFSDAAKTALLLEEYVIFQASSAALKIAPEKAEAEAPAAE